MNKFKNTNIYGQLNVKNLRDSSNNIITNASATLDGKNLITEDKLADYVTTTSLTASLNLKANQTSISNINNTSDLLKPISTATQSVLDLKANINSPSFTGIPLSITAAVGTNTSQIATTAFVLANQSVGGSSNLATNNIWVGTNQFNIAPTMLGTAITGLTKSQVGLSNVDNISDINKPISTAEQNALNLKANQSSISNINNTSDLLKPISTATQTALDLKANQSSISNINNTSDLLKPVSTAVQSALDLKANLFSPSFTGTPLSITAVVGTNTNQIATTAFVLANQSASSQLDLKANIDSPSFIGTPLSITAPVGTNNFQIATTAFVLANQSVSSQSALDLKANIDSQIFTGICRVPTAPSSTNTTQIASCAFVLENAAISSSGINANSNNIFTGNNSFQKTLVSDVLSTSAITFNDRTFLQSEYNNSTTNFTKPIPDMTLSNSGINLLIAQVIIPNNYTDVEGYGRRSVNLSIPFGYKQTGTNSSGNKSINFSSVTLSIYKNGVFLNSLELNNNINSASFGTEGITPRGYFFLKDNTFTSLNKTYNILNNSNYSFYQYYSNIYINFYPQRAIGDDDIYLFYINFIMPATSSGITLTGYAPGTIFTRGIVINPSILSRELVNTTANNADGEWASLQNASDNTSFNTGVLKGQCFVKSLKTGWITTDDLQTNTVSLLYSTVPTFTTNQIGYIYTQFTSNTITTTQNTYLTISSLPIGVYIINANIDNCNGGTIGQRVFIYAGSTKLISCTGMSITNVSTGGVNASYFYNNTSVKNITLQAIATPRNASLCEITLQAIRIA